MFYATAVPVVALLTCFIFCLWRILVLIFIRPHGSMLITTMSKTVELIEMPFRGKLRGPRNRVQGAPKIPVYFETLYLS